MDAFHLAIFICAHLINAEPCIPANTCFAISGGNDVSYFDKSFKMECNADGTVAKHIYNGVTDCSGSTHSTTYPDPLEGVITDGDKQADGLGSGGIMTQYLQGTYCAIDAASEDCTEYMVLKHRGDPSAKDSTGDSRPFIDIGDNCTNYIGNEASFTQYETVVAPVGCVNLYAPGSHLYECDATGWSFKHYSGKDCSGDILSAQSAPSDGYRVNDCGYFSEWTHCNSVETGQTSGCVNDGVHVYFWYWYDLECCPSVQTCVATAGIPTAPTTGSPASFPASTPTASPVSSNNIGTPTVSPVSGSGTGTGTTPTSSPEIGSGGGNSGNTPTASPAIGSGGGSTPASSPASSPNSSPVSSDGSTATGDNFGENFWWWWIIVVLLVVCCLCILCVAFFSYRRKRGNQYFGSGF